MTLNSSWCDSPSSCGESSKQLLRKRGRTGQIGKAESLYKFRKTYETGRTISMKESTLPASARNILKAFKIYGKNASTTSTGETTETVLLSLGAFMALLEDLSDTLKSLSEARISRDKIPQLQEFIKLAEETRRLSSSPDAPIASILRQQFSVLRARQKRTSAKEKLIVNPLLKPLESLRSNRDPRATFEKVAHRMILTTLLFYGALPKTKSDFGDAEDFDPKALTNKETKDIFDEYCPACEKRHTIEAVKKLKTRFLRDMLANASNYKREKVSATETKLG